MSNIRVDLNCPIKDGTEVVFRSPVDCSQVTGLIVYYPGENGITTSKEFAFADAHGNNVGDIDHLFAENVAVKVILDDTTSMAFVQNADTNAYLEGRFADLENKIGTGVGGASIDDTKIATNTAWSSSKTELEIENGVYREPIETTWSIGGLQSADGTENKLDTRIRTDFIESTHLRLVFDKSVYLHVYFYSDNKASAYIGKCAGWITTPTNIDNLVPDGTRYVRLMARYASDQAIKDITAITSLISIHALLGTVVDLYGDYQHDIPENIGVLNAILNFKQLAELRFTPKAVLPQQVEDLPAGKESVGLPYSSSRPEAGFVPNFVSLYTFMTALQNPNSYLYTVDLGELGNDNGDTYYGAVCSTSCCYALNIVPNYTTHQWKDIPGMMPLDWQSVYALKMGDTICNKTSGHVVMVTDITRNKRGKIGLITITEAASNKVKSFKYTPEKLEKQFPTSDFAYYRYSKIHEVRHIQSPFVAVEDEIPQDVTYNTTLIPRKGDKANWLAGTDVEIDILDKGSYTDAEIYKDDVLVKTVPLNGGSDVAIDRTVYGIEWVKGAILVGDGTDTTGSTSVRTSSYIPSTSVEISLPSGVEARVFFYDGDQSYITYSSYVTGNVSVSSLAPDGAKLIRVLCRYSDESTIGDVNAFCSGINVEIPEGATTRPIPLEAGGFSSSDGSESSANAYRARSIFMPVQNLNIVGSSKIQYYVYFYNSEKVFISHTGGWLSGTKELMSIVPDNAAYFRVLIKANSETAMTKVYGKWSLEITAELLGDAVAASDESVDVIVLSDLTYGKYKARLTDGVNTSDWCYWMVVAADSFAESTGNPGEIRVTFGASNATPLFIAWNDGTNNGTVHISTLTEEDLEHQIAECTYKSGSFKIRVAFKTEYGIIHSALPDAITVS